MGAPYRTTPFSQCMSFGDEEITLVTETSWSQDLFGLDDPMTGLPWASAHERKYLVSNHVWGDGERLLYLCREHRDAHAITAHTS